MSECIFGFLIREVANDMPTTDTSVGRTIVISVFGSQALVVALALLKLFLLLRYKGILAASYVFLIFIGAGGMDVATRQAKPLNELLLLRWQVWLVAISILASRLDYES